MNQYISYQRNFDSIVIYYYKENYHDSSKLFINIEWCGYITTPRKQTNITGGKKMNGVLMAALVIILVSGGIIGYQNIKTPDISCTCFLASTTALMVIIFLVVTS